VCASFRESARNLSGRKTNGHDPHNSLRWLVKVKIKGNLSFWKSKAGSRYALSAQMFVNVSGIFSALSNKERKLSHKKE
jgi:hypothetical protein